MKKKAKRLRLVGGGVGKPTFHSKIEPEPDPNKNKEELAAESRRNRLMYEFKRVEEHTVKALHIAGEMSPHEQGYYYQSIEEGLMLAMHLGGMMCHGINEYRMAALSVTQKERLDLQKAQLLDAIVMSARMVSEKLAEVGFILEGMRYRALAAAQMPRRYREEDKHEDDGTQEAATPATRAPEGLGSEDGEYQGLPQESEDERSAGSEDVSGGGTNESGDADTAPGE